MELFVPLRIYNFPAQIGDVAGSHSEPQAVFFCCVTVARHISRLSLKWSFSHRFPAHCLTEPSEPAVWINGEGTSRRILELTETKPHHRRLRDHFHLDRNTRLVSCTILRNCSRIWAKIAVLSSWENNVGGGVSGGKGRNSGTIQISRAASNEMTLADTHQRKYCIIHFSMKASLTT